MENVTDARVMRIAKAFLFAWEEAYSDNGALWERARDALDLECEGVPEELVQHAQDVATASWRRRYGGVRK